MTAPIKDWSEPLLLAQSALRAADKCAQLGDRERARDLLAEAQHWAGVARTLLTEGGTCTPST